MSPLHLHTQGLAPFRFMYLLPSTLLLLLQSGIIQSRRVVNYEPVEMGRSETIGYFSSVLQRKTSSLDPLNEEIFANKEFAEDLYHRIDNLMPKIPFIRYLLKTKNITDKVDHKGRSLLSRYVGNVNGPCSPDSIWPYSIPDILEIWDGDRSVVMDDLEEYHKRNLQTSESDICNRFRGLSCQSKKKDPKQATCQCDGDPKYVEFVKGVDESGEQHYPDGCYIRAWHPCRHLSMDTAFPQTFQDFHSNLQGQRSQLSQMVFPVARPDRCIEGTYCLDLIPGMDSPVCWCAGNSSERNCVENEEKKDPQRRVPPIGKDLGLMRREFVKLFIAENDRHTTCDPGLNSNVQNLVSASGKDPIASGSVKFMKDLISRANSGNIARICDFRKGLFCDSVSNTCVGKELCDPGTIEVKRGVCAVNNGFKCRKNEDCVDNAKCRLVKGTKESVCQCETGYGDRCALQNAAFFSKLFIPIASGFEEEEFIQHQVKISNILDAWEGKMKLREDHTCDPIHDSISMKVVNYFGNLGQYDPAKGERLLNKLKQIIERGPKLCMYTKFLRCHDGLGKCVPILGEKILSGIHTKSGKGQNYIHVEASKNGECGDKNLPVIFQNLVTYTCSIGFKCESHRGQKICIPDCTSESAPEDLCGKDNELIKRSNDGLDGDKNEVQLPRESIQKRQATTPAPTTPAIEILKSGETQIDRSMAKAQGSSSTPVPSTLSPPTTGLTQPPPPTSPPRKAYHGENCEFTDDLSMDFDTSQFHKVCDASRHFICKDGFCECWETLTFVFHELECMIPLGAHCDEESVNLPLYMDFDKLHCQNGACIRDNGREICRPESDEGLVIVEYKDEL